MLLNVLFLYKKTYQNCPKMCLKYRKTTLEKPSTDCFDVFMSTTVVCNDLQQFFKILMGKLEFYGLISMKKLNFDFRHRFLSFFNFMLFKFQNAISQEPCF